MKESNLQDYLYDNLEEVFQGKVIENKKKEYLVHGKRIDILATVDGIKYIIELKAVRFTRKDVGQIAEYYGLMKESLHEENLKMIVIAPDIPIELTVLLKGIGILFFEVEENEEDETFTLRQPSQKIKTNTKKTGSVSLSDYQLAMQRYWDDFKLFTQRNSLFRVDDNYTLSSDKCWFQIPGKRSLPWVAFVATKKEIACTLTVDFQQYKTFDYKEIEQHFKILFQKYFNKNIYDFGSFNNKSNNKMCRIKFFTDKWESNSNEEYFQWYIEVVQVFLDVFKSRINVIDEIKIVI